MPAEPCPVPSLTERAGTRKARACSQGKLLGEPRGPTPTCSPTGLEYQISTFQEQAPLQVRAHNPVLIPQEAGMSVIPELEVRTGSREAEGLFRGHPTRTQHLGLCA